MTATFPKKPGNRLDKSLGLFEFGVVPGLFDQREAGAGISAA